MKLRSWRITYRAAGAVRAQYEVISAPHHEAALEIFHQRHPGLLVIGMLCISE